MKSPWSVAGGIEYSKGKTRIEISAEYFCKIALYKMIRAEAKPFVYPTEVYEDLNLEELEFLSIYNYANSVLNVGIAIEQKINEKYTYIGSFRTDFSNFIDEVETDEYIMAGGDWNLFHFASGVSLMR
jgi:hypothetical protein